MYEKIEQLSDDETKGRDYAVATGDFSDVEREGKAVKRKVGYNDRGQMLVYFCKIRQMYIANT